MKKFSILTSILVLGLTYNPLFAFAEGKPSFSSKCIKEMKQRDEIRNQLIMDDIISTFSLDIDDKSYREFSLAN